MLFKLNFLTKYKNANQSKL